jgi:hypothetical protein
LGDLTNTNRQIRGTGKQSLEQKKPINKTPRGKIDIFVAPQTVVTPVGIDTKKKSSTTKKVKSSSHHYF